MSNPFVYIGGGQFTAGGGGDPAGAPMEVRGGNGDAYRGEPGSWVVPGEPEPLRLSQLEALALQFAFALARGRERTAEEIMRHSFVYANAFLAECSSRHYE